MSELKVSVVQTSDEIEAQTESAAAMAIGLLEDAEDFQLADDVFDRDALAGDRLSVLLLLLSIRRMFGAFLEG